MKSTVDIHGQRGMNTAAFSDPQCGLMQYSHEPAKYT